VDNITDRDTLIEALLQERDELYQELSSLREIDKGALKKAEEKNRHYEHIIFVFTKNVHLYFLYFFCWR
jgi:transposase